MIRGHLNTAGIALAGLVFAAGAIVSGCADHTSAQAPSAMTGMRLDADYSAAGEAPGALSEAHSFPTIDRRLRALSSLAARVEYTSTSGITGGLTQVSGSVFVPKGEPPEGGWPIVVYAHATTGIESDCAPSLSPTLLGTSNVVTALVNAGFVVTVPDYQGLGVDSGDDGGYHPYLDSTTAGYNVIDSVKAARHLVPEASERWVAIGVSQGGQATWAANELAASYGAGLALLGTVSVSPAADITGFADAAAGGQLTAEQMPALVVLLETLHRAYPDFPLDDYRRGFVKDNWDTLIACDGPEAAERAGLTLQLSGADLVPSTPQALDTLRAHLQRMSLPQHPTSAPMLVLFGGEDALVPQAWTEHALRAACGMGDVIDIQLQPDKGHAAIDVSSAFGWVNARFRGEPAPDSCLGLAPMGAPQ
ncbi:putative lipase [Mycolicibacterium pulveris]|uniref:Putative lipase n=1 Tax=Mycolicibacterium pulveris TaxID=36813 RepID=A0A7I7UDY6_MYCPV|nr:alpha/beta fold hydrolase [Mycolicibacterium pulveris]BBY79694.1 putative lipase [Mycolicibacterium pulveris]